MSTSTSRAAPELGKRPASSCPYCSSSSLDEERGPILAVDLKGDDSMEPAIREAARQAGRTFRFFTNESGRYTHAFNVIAELRASGLPLSRSGETFRSALNLEHGAGLREGPLLGDQPRPAPGLVLKRYPERGRAR